MIKCPICGRYMYKSHSELRNVQEEYWTEHDFTCPNPDCTVMFIRINEDYIPNKGE
jgi:hypothetical protein